VWFKDPRGGARVKQVVRDHIHFKEEIFEHAERIVAALGGDFNFSCLHVRRNDFQVRAGGGGGGLTTTRAVLGGGGGQFKDVWTPAPVIVSNVAGLFNKGETVYIATDELSKKDDKVHFDPAAIVRSRPHARRPLTPATATACRPKRRTTSGSSPCSTPGAGEKR
jgi:hypothetical protein